MKKLLITGGSGFIGTNLIENILFSNQYEILNLDIARPKIQSHISIWKAVDIRNLELLEKTIKDFNPHIVIHLAARTDLNGKTIEDYDTNTLGVSNLIEILNNLKSLESVVFASSMYVCEPGYIPKNYEDYKPHTIYGISKVETEKIIKSTELNFTWTIIRPTSIWGPWFSEPYADFFKIVMSKKYFHMGSKACSKTYGYIDNTVFQIIAIINAIPEKINKKVFYLGDFPAYNISEWADEIAQSIGIKIPRIPYSLFKLAGWCGDFLKLIGIKFPMTSFRLKNMTTDNVHDLKPILKIAQGLPISRIEGVQRTIVWIGGMKN
ncbi:Nucleoside-diphosphate-sugar epimerase [Flavobacterium fluvii]|uniref:Nucleoside-diphosphate-sugar epimerase n=1 Tax=Flavobacterium fluvii TaxID=468056 RepID=A0A1M5IM04_9FLAO|nr:NAD(P)-dependent oxidoreductase [Flavobacterium fluvii]SHG28960.1 Nucleoside-diphosphate-sugar epimerase [Flavobacterium fluvii]